MQKLKILMVNVGFIPESVGGSEFYTYNLSRFLTQRGYEITVFTALEDLSSKRYEVIRTEIEGIKVIKVVNSWLNARSFNEHFMDPIIDDIFREMVLEEKPDLIHFQHVAYLSGNLIEIAHEMNIPSILTLHDYWYICFRSRLLRPDYEICSGPENGLHCATCGDLSAAHPMAVSNYPLLIKLMHRPALKNLITNVLDKIPQPFISRVRAFLFKNPGQNGNTRIAPVSLAAGNKFRFEYYKRQLRYPAFLLSPSQHLKRRYEAQGYPDILVLPLGYSRPDRVKPLPFQGILKIAFIGNIERHKGVTLLLNELLEIPADRVRINIHGRAKDPTYYSEAKKVARQYSKGVVKFHGEYRSDRDLPNIFSQNHLLLFPSVWEENAPLVVREAILYGVPVVGSKLGGVPEVVEDGSNGFLFDPFIKGDLAGVIRHILTRPDVLKKITYGAGHTEIESMADHVTKLTDLYDRTLIND